MNMFETTDILEVVTAPWHDDFSWYAVLGEVAHCTWRKGLETPEITQCDCRVFEITSLSLHKKIERRKLFFHSK